MKTGYLARLWDQMALRVLTNTRDFDARDDQYAQQVSTVVWQTVRRLRMGRKAFHADIQLAIEEKAKTRLRKPLRRRPRTPTG